MGLLKAPKWKPGVSDTGVVFCYEAARKRCERKQMIQGYICQGCRGTSTSLASHCACIDPLEREAFHNFCDEALAAVAVEESLAGVRRKKNPRQISLSLMVEWQRMLPEDTKPQHNEVACLDGSLILGEGPGGF